MGSSSLLQAREEASEQGDRLIGGIFANQFSGQHQEVGTDLINFAHFRETDTRHVSASMGKDRYQALFLQQQQRFTNRGTAGAKLARKIERDKIIARLEASLNDSMPNPLGD